MDNLFNIFALVVIGAHIVTLLFANRQNRKHPGFWFLVGLVGLPALAVMTQIPDTRLSQALSWREVRYILLAGVLVSYGWLVLNELQPRKIWLRAGAVWLAGLLIAALVEPQAIFTVVMLAGVGIITLTLIGVGLYAFYQATLPEAANRALVWVTGTTALALGVLLAGSSSHATATGGILLVLWTAIATNYAVRVHRLPEIRAGMILALRSLIFVGTATTIIFTAFYLLADADPAQTDDLLLMAVVALGVAALLVPLRDLTQWLVVELTRNQRIDPVAAVRHYSHALSQASDSTSLVTQATEAITRIMRVRESRLLLISAQDDDHITLTDSINLAIKRPLHTALTRDQKAITQFDVLHKYPGDAPPFIETGMHAYAPVILDGKLAALLACGPRLNDTPFFSRDLDLLTALAGQTAIALHNVNLLKDQQHLNSSMQTLNQTLQEANNQLGRMDSVKTDFVTIASHELRTPLAQVRGYTDIIDALNEQGMLDETQISNLVGNLRKAAERMEELIAAMLDVSQLDVNAMDLNLTDTAPEAILRMAIEPLTDAIQQRRLTLLARGLRGLPTVQADLQRLVQAFRNIIVNAIKFTPDGGRIDISASLQESPAGDQVLISIQDNGVGIDPQNLEMVFKKFFRAYSPSLHSTGTYKFMGAGPGLGLTIARGVIEGHGGKIWAESPGHDLEERPGTIFHVLLPVSTPESARRVLSFDGSDTSETAAVQTQ